MPLNWLSSESVDHRTRVQKYLGAEEQVAMRYPEDDEAQIAYAITLNVAASPADKAYAALLEPIFKRQPEHPGVAHYLIHLYDYPALAEKGLEAAKQLYDERCSLRAANFVRFNFPATSISPKA